ncbi:TPA: hypothetical protein EYP44_00675 [Candidatus Bathyarchaeota archaeon]|nr:hypothetical protein [Candidatus Bathyarchaeota archaeon]
MRAVDVSAAAIFTALVCVATMMLSIYVPATRGYFNVGETMVYTTALLFGPFIGAFAGGVGSMLADLFLGYVAYAPGTLAIKACEGAVVGLLARKRPVGSRSAWRVYTLALGSLAGFLLALIGASYYSGSMELRLGIPPPEKPMILVIPPELWYVLGSLVFCIVALMGFYFEPEFGWIVFSVLVGGMEMILGYYLYELMLVGAVAIVEVVVNIAQMMVGLIVSLPVVRALRRAFPQLKSMYR